MKKEVKNALVLLLIFAVVFGVVGCADKGINNNSSLDGVGSIATSENEETSSNAKSEQSINSSNSTKSEQSTNSSKVSDKTNNEDSASSKFKRPISSSKSSSKKTSTSSAKEKNTSLYMLDYVFRNSIYKNEYNNRGELYNTLYKLQNGEDITIAYLGGRITEQKTWRPFTTKWFEDNFSGKVNEVEIGTSGTGADLAVCRIDEEILVHNPDLIFIEYAVNGELLDANK